MGETEKITFEQVQSGVNEIRQCAKIMNDIFESVTGNMNTMTSDEVFQGKARETLRETFEPFRGQFKNYVAKVEEFANAYSAANKTLEETEARLASQASNLG